MPHQMWRPRCLCTPAGRGIFAPYCKTCGHIGEYDGWHLSTVELMCAYQRRTGMKLRGPHRELTDELFEGRNALCQTCHGRGVMDVDEGRRWKTCPECRGGCYVFKGTVQELQEIRSRILSRFPDAAAPPPVSAEEGESGLKAGRIVKEDGGSGLGKSERALCAIYDFFKPEAAVRCDFYTMAVRNEALQKKWRAGLHDYWRRYRTAHNGSLTISCFRETSWDDQYDALIENGLTEGKDFIIIDAGRVLESKDLEPFHFRVDWLDGYIHEAGLMIHLKH
jgi:hypothetical protein